MRLFSFRHGFSHGHAGRHQRFADAAFEAPEGRCRSHGWRWHVGAGMPFGDDGQGEDGRGGWFGGGGRRGGGGRMFGHGDLKLLLLAMIEQQPRHGYELIRIIGEMFHGQYTPSPGAIYPTLTLLEDMGYAVVSPEAGGRKLYAITEVGREFLQSNRPAVEAATSRAEHNARMAAKMAAPTAIRQAMHALKHALLMRGSRWNEAETRRIADILERAASDIARGPLGD